MAKVDPRDFLLNTDYEMDKIIYFKELDRTVSSVTTVTIAHKLPTVPLVFGLWSTNEDFSDSHELGNYANPWTQSKCCRVRADRTNIYVDFTPKKENGSYVSTHLYVKVFGFEPGSNDHSQPSQYQLSKLPIGKTYKYAEQFVINTDYNYLKLISNNPPFNWDAGRGCLVYAHNLGYTPHVMSWWSIGWDYIGNNIEFEPDSSFSYSESGSKSGFFVTNTEALYYSGIIVSDNEVRIYADEA